MERERVAVPMPAASSASAAALLAESELGDDDLEQVVGGLERIYVPGHVVAADF